MNKPNQKSFSSLSSGTKSRPTPVLKEFFGVSQDGKSFTFSKNGKNLLSANNEDRCPVGDMKFYLTKAFGNPKLDVVNAPYKIAEHGRRKQQKQSSRATRRTSKKKRQSASKKAGRSSKKRKNASRKRSSGRSKQKGAKSRRRKQSTRSGRSQQSRKRQQEQGTSHPSAGTQGPSSPFTGMPGL